MSTDQIAQPPGISQQCAFCRRPIAQRYFHVDDRMACDECGGAVVRFIHGTRITNVGLVRAGLAAFGAAIACAIGWAVITHVSHTEWGLVAALIGFVTARAALKASPNQRGTPMQILASGAAIFGILLGKILVVSWVIVDMLQKEGKAIESSRILITLFRIARDSPTLIVGGLDLVWIGIAVFSAWRICRAATVRIAGPFGVGITPAQESSTIPYASPYIAPAPKAQSSLRRSILLTTVSMIISAAIYTAFMQSWVIAVGFVLLILVHEMGHVIANVHYGLSASPPIFIPFLGAVINLKQRPANAWVEAVIGIAGPVAGTIGTFIVFLWYLQTRSEMALTLAWFGFTINLFNMLPLPPLDGGRVAAAISPWIWIVGLAGLGAMVYFDFRSGQDISLLMILLVIALPRVMRMLKGAERGGPYYQIGAAKNFSMGACYLVLLAILAGFRWYTHTKLGMGGFF